MDFYAKIDINNRLEPIQVRSLDILTVSTLPKQKDRLYWRFLTRSTISLGLIAELRP